MRHSKRLKKLGLPKSHRESLLKNLTASLILHGRIRTTLSRAKVLSGRFDRLINLIQRKEPRETIRILPKYCTIETACKKLLKELKPKYEKRKSGFTRLTRIGMRKGDNAKLVQIELV